MLKAIARKMIKDDHRLFLSWYKRHFGFLPAIRAYVDLLCNKGIGRAPDGLTGGSVFIRPGTADQKVYEEVLVAKKYDVDLGDPHFIVDAGAHIGLTSVFFANKCPQATIVAIEPEPTNFDMLLMNTKNYSNVKPIQAGLWNKRGHLRIQDSNAATWGFRVSEDKSGQGIPAVRIRDVMSDFNASQVDVLKMDIEGSELEVLDDHSSWIDYVSILIIELHDRFRPGCSEALASAISGHNYDKSHSGMNTIIANLRRIAVKQPHFSGSGSKREKAGSL